MNLFNRKQKIDQFYKGGYSTIHILYSIQNMKRIRSAIRTLLCSLWFVIATIIIALLVYLNIHRRTEPMTTVGGGGGGGEPRHSSPYLPNMGNQRVTGMNAQMCGQIKGIES